jgi:hypothetical protein
MARIVAAAVGSSESIIDRLNDGHAHHGPESDDYFEFLSVFCSYLTAPSATTPSVLRVHRTKLIFDSEAALSGISCGCRPLLCDNQLEAWSQVGVYLCEAPNSVNRQSRADFFSREKRGLKEAEN